MSNDQLPFANIKADHGLLRNANIIAAVDRNHRDYHLWVGPPGTARLGNHSLVGLSVEIDSTNPEQISELIALVEQIKGGLHPDAIEWRERNTQ